MILFINFPKNLLLKLENHRTKKVVFEVSILIQILWLSYTIYTDISKFKFFKSLLLLLLMQGRYICQKMRDNDKNIFNLNSGTYSGKSQLVPKPQKCAKRRKKATSWRKKAHAWRQKASIGAFWRLLTHFGELGKTQCFLIIF